MLLQVNKALRSLDLTDNSIGAEGAAAIGSALKENTCLTKLNLSNIPVYNSPKIGPQGAKSIADALFVNRTLTSLNLTWNRIEPEGAYELGKALQVSTRMLIHYFTSQVRL